MAYISHRATASLGVGAPSSTGRRRNSNSMPALSGSTWLTSPSLAPKRLVVSFIEERGGWRRSGGLVFDAKTAFGFDLET